MAGRISTAELADAVAMYLDEIIGELSGRQAFHGKVAKNVLAIIAREARADTLHEETRFYEAETNETGDAARAEFCRRIRDGEVDAFDERLVLRMSGFVTARLAVDNPKFSTLARLKEAD